MVELTCGSKRRRSDADENERIALRQMVFNMSICKLQKDLGRKEPSLLRSVVITNTVRHIENEMDEELLYDYNNNFFEPSLDELDFEQEKNSEAIIQINQPEIENQTNTLMLEESISEDKQTSDIVITEPSKFGIIGDRRKTAAEENDHCYHKPLIQSGFLWDSLSLPSNNNTVTPLESMELEQNFPDVDIALYDYDSNTPLQCVPSNEWRIFPTSCAMEYECRKPDAFFEELDQIMQVLVGM